MRKPLPVVFVLLIVVLLWGSAFPAIRAARLSYNPGHMALIRFLVASAAVAVYALKTGVRIPRGREWFQFGLCGILGITLYQVFLNYGAKTVSAGSMSAIINSVPLFTAGMAVLCLGERLPIIGWAGLVLGIIGALLIAFGEGKGFHLSPGVFLLLIASCSWSGYVIIQKPLLARWRPFEINAWAIWIGTALLLIFSPGVVNTVRGATPQATLSVVYLGLFPTSIAYVLWSVALQRTTASKASAFMYLIPVVAFALGAVWLAEKPSLLSVLGTLVAMSAVALVNSREAFARLLGRRAVGEPRPAVGFAAKTEDIG